MTTPSYTDPPADPRAELRSLRADSALSPEIAALRLAVLRQDVPDALVQIDSVRADDTAIAVKATIGLPGGARHSGIAAMDVDPARSWADQHAMTEAIAIARALDGLGIRVEKPQPATQHTQGASASAVPQSPTAEARQQTSPQQTPGASAMQKVDGDHLSEYSWTSFWQAAHARNITREQVEQALGRSVQQATPRDAVDALQAAGMWG